MRSGYVCRGQGVRKDERFGTIQRLAAEVDGELFVIVRFRDGEELVSVDELLPASRACELVKENEVDVEEEFVAEVTDETTEELETRIENRENELASEDSDDDNGEPEEFEEEAEAVEEFEE